MSTEIHIQSMRAGKTYRMIRDPIKANELEAWESAGFTTTSTTDESKPFTMQVGLSLLRYRTDPALVLSPLEAAHRTLIGGRRHGTLHNIPGDLPMEIGMVIADQGLIYRFYDFRPGKGHPDIPFYAYGSLSTHQAISMFKNQHREFLAGLGFDLPKIVLKIEFDKLSPHHSWNHELDLNDIDRDLRQILAKAAYSGHSLPSERLEMRYRLLGKTSMQSLKYDLDVDLRSLAEAKDYNEIEAILLYPKALLRRMAEALGATAFADPNGTPL